MCLGCRRAGPFLFLSPPRKKPVSSRPVAGSGLLLKAAVPISPRFGWCHAISIRRSKGGPPTAPSVHNPLFFPVPHDDPLLTFFYLLVLLVCDFFCFSPPLMSLHNVVLTLSRFVILCNDLSSKRNSSLCPTTVGAPFRIRGIPTTFFLHIRFGAPGGCRF